jgi:hypothetical protein
MVESNIWEVLVADRQSAEEFFGDADGLIKK